MSRRLYFSIPSAKTTLKSCLVIYYVHVTMRAITRTDFLSVAVFSRGKREKGSCFSRTCSANETECQTVVKLMEGLQKADYCLIGTGTVERSPNVTLSA